MRLGGERRRDGSLLIGGISGDADMEKEDEKWEWERDLWNTYKQGEGKRDRQSCPRCDHLPVVE